MVSSATDSFAVVTQQCQTSLRGGQRLSSCRQAGVSPDQPDGVTFDGVSFHHNGSFLEGHAQKHFSTVVSIGNCNGLSLSPLSKGENLFKQQLCQAIRYKN